MKNKKLTSVYFCGNKASDYAIKHGYLDFKTFAQSFDCVMNNDIIQNTATIGYWDTVNGAEYEVDENGNMEWTDIYQYFIVSAAGAEIIMDYTDEILFYNEALDMYVWGVSHWGTSWDYVLTDIKLNCGYDNL